MQAEYHKAWEHLVEANRLQRDTYTFNPQVLQPFNFTVLYCRHQLAMKKLPLEFC